MTEKLGAPLAQPIFERIAIVGVGLIGSSIARAARRTHAAGFIAIADVSPTVRARADALKLGDHIVDSAAEAAKGADLVILCAPVGANEGLAREIAPALKAGAIVSDVGSVKGAVVAALSPSLPAGVHLVPAHPVAGTEESGPDAGFATLFVNRWCILTPPEDTRLRRDRQGARLLGGARLQRRGDERHAS